MPVLAADFSVGVRWNHFQLLGSGDFWSEYVSDKYIDEYRWNGSDWEHRETLASSAQCDDFSNFNAIPALKFSARFEKYELVTDVEYYQSEEVRITEYTMLQTKKNTPFVYDYEETAELTLITLKETFNYFIPYKKSLMYVGGGIGVYSYDLEDELRYVKYRLEGKTYFADEDITYDYSDSGVGFGIHVAFGYEHNLSDTWKPFFEVSYQYAVAKFDPDGLGTEPYYSIPNTPPSDNPTVDDLYGSYKGKISDSYNITFDAFKVSAGVNFWL